MKRFKNNCANSIENIDTVIDFEMDNKPKKLPRTKKIWNHFQEFAENTSLHGLKYIGERKRSLSERIWWLFVVLLSMMMCIYVIYKVWYKWNTNPVIVSFAETSTPIWEIPFSAVTICNESKLKQTKFNFTKAYNNFENDTIESEELQKLQNMLLVCPFMDTYPGNFTTNESTIEFIKEMAPTIDDMFTLCKLGNQDVDCSRLLSPLLTEDGLCYTFNMLDINDFFTNKVSPNVEYLKHKRVGHGWTLDGGYKGNHLHSYPRRVKGVGENAGLEFILRTVNNELDYLCRGPVEGYKVTLHNPAEYPRVSHSFYRIPLDQEVLLSVRPDMMTTTEGLRNYSPFRRKCFFPEDRQLYFYKIYTQQNCELECLTNYTLRACYCVSFYMPQNGTTPICASGNINCMKRAKDKVMLATIEENLEINAMRILKSKYFVKRIKKMPKANDCNCLPACTQLKYDGETSQANFNWQAFFKALPVADSPSINVSQYHYTHLSIFFKDSQIITSKRSELYGLTDFLANCGGLLGLFMGFSFLSLLEIFYFCSIRIFFERRNKKLTRCKGPNVE